MSEILIVDDEASMRELLEILFSREGWQARSVPGLQAALKALEEQVPDVVVCDMRLKDGSGMDLLRRIKSNSPQVEVIMITAYGTDKSALEALSLGAYDYVHKPFEVDEMKVVVARALERQRLLRENQRMRLQLRGEYRPGGIVGSSPAMQAVYNLIEQVAPTRSSVLITGESGTGKELVARAIHQKSARAGGPFVPIDCASIPETLLESELFGYSRGAFTGAAADRQGLFELASGGTVFLDEVAEIPLSMQVKLLRVLQERTLRRLGDNRDRQVDVRVLAATNRNLEKEVKEGRLREDLFFRLNVIRIHLPPLRERKEDLEQLALHFIEEFSRREGRSPPQLLGSALQKLKKYHFPGNVRELQNLVERAVALAGSNPLGPEHFILNQSPNSAGPTQLEELDEKGVNLDEIMARIERHYLERALALSGGVKTRAAELLGITFRSMRYRLLKHGLEKEGEGD
jgi:two-component system response regulator PilR (NtrC family)